MFRNGQNHHNTSIDTTKCLKINVRRLIAGNLMTCQVPTNVSMEIMRWYFVHDSERNNFKREKGIKEEHIFHIIKLYKYQVQSISGLN